MDLKRILTSLIGGPAVILLICFGNAQIISIVIMALAVICMSEYFSVIKKICKPIKWIGYLSTFIIFLVSIIKLNTIFNIIIFGLPIIILILFLHIIITDMKTTLKDITYTLMGILYVTGFMTFLSLIIIGNNGKMFFGYALVIAWATDIFAYAIGKKYGKHHFSKVSPKKSIEGCIAGLVAATFFGIVYAIICRNFGVIQITNNIQYLYIGIITLMLSAISQVGDFVASCIKRFADAKDYGNILPGHGGMLDRIDSLIFIAPFIYFITTII